MSHIKESKNIGYFGYLQDKKFVTIDKGFKVSNGPAIDESKVTLYFSDSLNSSIYEYSLKNFKKKTFIKIYKNQGFQMELL